MHDLDIQGARLHCQVDTSAMEEFMHWLAARGIRDLTSQPPTLEELFLRHYAVRTDGTPQAKQVSP